MPRTLTTEMAATIAAKRKSPFFAIEIRYAADWVRFWTGRGTLTFGGNDYLGTGKFAGVGASEETTDLRAVGQNVSLGLDATLLAQTVTALRPHLPLRIWLGFLDDTGQPIADPIGVFRGSAGVPSSEDSGAACTLVLSAESRLADAKRPRVIRLTSEDQKTRVPGDEGFAFVPLLQDVSLEGPLE